MGDIRHSLEGYEWKLQPSRIQNLGTDADLALMRIVREGDDYPNYYRLRALEALSLFPSERVAQFLESYLKSPQEEPAHLLRALDSLSKGFAFAQPQRVQRAAESLLGHESPHVRVLAAKTLRRLNTADSRQAVVRYLDRESETWARQAVQSDSGNLTVPSQK